MEQEILISEDEFAAVAAIVAVQMIGGKDNIDEVISHPFKVSQEDGMFGMMLTMFAGELKRALFDEETVKKCVEYIKEKGDL